MKAQSRMTRRKSKLSSVPRNLRRRLRIECFEERKLLAGPTDVLAGTNEIVIASSTANTAASIVELSNVNEGHAVVLNGGFSSVASNFWIESTTTENNDVDFSSNADNHDTFELGVLSRVDARDQFHPAVDADTNKGIDTQWRSPGDIVRDQDVPLTVVLGWQSRGDISFSDANSVDTTDLLTGQAFPAPTPFVPSIGSLAATGPVDHSPPESPNGVDRASELVDLRDDPEFSREASDASFAAQDHAEPEDAVILSTMNALMTASTTTYYASNRSSDGHSQATARSNTVVNGQANAQEIATAPRRVMAASQNAFHPEVHRAQSFVTVQHSEVNLAFETDSESSSTRKADAPDPLSLGDASPSRHHLISVDVQAKIEIRSSSERSFSFQSEILEDVANLFNAPTALLVVATIWTQTSLSARKNAKDDKRSFNEIDGK